ncbi:hypothetical protein GGF39_003246 [Coemansia sp. RSA 1721]|nr:hypothetical protein GGF39_003246 [Coemansia sp. RSA 1721]
MSTAAAVLIPLCSILGIFALYFLFCWYLAHRRNTSYIRKEARDDSESVSGSTIYSTSMAT